MEFNSINDCLDFIVKNQGRKDLYIAGAGRYGKILGRYLDDHKIRWNGYVDRCPELTESDRKRVISYDDIRGVDGIFLVSSVSFKHEIKESLTGQGISDEDIITFSDTKYFWNMFSQCYTDYKKYTARIKKFRNIHAGERCFIIGNGPSLRAEDLDQLKDEYTFAVNSIYCMYPYTEWRPTYYVAVSSDLFLMELPDKASFANVIEGCRAAFTTMLVRAFDYRDDEDMEKVHYFETRNFEESVCQGLQFSEDCSDYMYCQTTVLYTVLQLAAYMGFREIYLIGVDCSYAMEIDEDGNVVDNHSSDYNDIMEQYYSERNITDMSLKKEGKAKGSYRTVEEYKEAKKYADSHSIQIYNATRGGKLEVFERVDFDSLMKISH